MPRDLLILTSTPPEVAQLITTAARIDGDLRLRTLDNRAVTELVNDDGIAVLSVGRPELMENPAEIERLVPEVAESVTAPVWWLDAWAPWGVKGELGVQVALEFAAALGGHCIVDDGS